MPDQITIQPVDDQGTPIPDLEYLPWGTRSLKLKVSGQHPGTMYILPEPPVQDQDRFEFITGDVHVSWGGGWEPGFQIKNLQPDAPVYAFFNLTHQGNSAADLYTLRLAAYDKEDMQHPVGQTKIPLRRPRRYDPGNMTLVRFKWEKTGLVWEPPSPPDSSRLHVPEYVARWWPTRAISYLDTSYARVTPPPSIHLHCIRNAKSRDLKIEVRAGNTKHLATFQGDIAFPLVDYKRIHADLYAIEKHWALRVWFFWLDEVFPKRYLDTLSPDQRQALHDWKKTQEIPDAERVDLIFDRDRDLKLRFLATDTHWRELWGVPDDTQPAPTITIGARSFLHATLNGFPELGALLAGKGNPLSKIKNRLSWGRAKGRGAFEGKHTPFISSTRFEPALGSGDVTKA
jgi:hypothetical protein